MCDTWLFKAPLHEFKAEGSALFSMRYGVNAKTQKCDKQAWHKLVYASTGWEPSTAVRVFSDDSVTRIIRHHMELCGTVTTTRCVDGHGVIHWIYLSPYKLGPLALFHPVFLVTHTFTHVVLFNHIRALLPPWLSVKCHWQWVQAWPMHNCIFRVSQDHAPKERRTHLPTCRIYQDCVA